MTSQSKHAFCKELVEGFLKALPKKTIQDLYKDHITLLSAKQVKGKQKVSFISLKTFEQRELRTIIINKLLISEYGYMFCDLEEVHIADLLGLSPRHYAYQYKNILKKLKVMRITNKEDISEFKLSLEELYFSPTIESEHSCEED